VKRVWKNKQTTNGFRFASASGFLNGAAAEAVLFGTGVANCSATQINTPEQLTIFNDTCFVAELSNSRALRFSLIQIEERPRNTMKNETETKTRFGNCAARAGGTAPEGVFGQPDLVSCLPGAAMNQLTGAIGVAVDANGTVWISDTPNARVLKFLNGQFRANQPTADGLQGLTGASGQEKNHRHTTNQKTKAKTKTKTNTTKCKPKQHAHQTVSTYRNTWRWIW